MLNPMIKPMNGMLLAGAAALLLTGIMMIQTGNVFRIADVLRYWLFFPMTAL
jgi:hypothetical protein